MRLISTSKEYADLWQTTMGSMWDASLAANAPEERASLRAEVDGLVAHAYGLTEDEFAPVLSTFPLVELAARVAALDAFRRFAPGTKDPEVAALLLAGEGREVEYKSSLRWDAKEQRKNADLERNVVKAVAGFLNAQGGNLLIGVDDSGHACDSGPTSRRLGSQHATISKFTWATCSTSGWVRTSLIALNRLSRNWMARTSAACGCFLRRGRCSLSKATIRRCSSCGLGMRLRL